MCSPIIYFLNSCYTNNFVLISEVFAKGIVLGVVLGTVVGVLLFFVKKLNN